MGLLKEGDKSGNSNAVWTGALQCSVKGAGILYKHINSSGITSKNIDKTNPFIIHTINTEVREYNLMEIGIRMFQEQEFYLYDSHIICIECCK